MQVCMCGVLTSISPAKKEQKNFEGTVGVGSSNSWLKQQTKWWIF